MTKTIYTVAVSYTPDDTTDLRQTDSLFIDEVRITDLVGSGFGFGVRDLEFEFATKEAAEYAVRGLKSVDTNLEFSVELYEQVTE